MPEPEAVAGTPGEIGATGMPEERRVISMLFADLVGSNALIERARQERDGPRRLELFHQADRMAVTEDVALIPLFYGRSAFIIKPRVRGWWEFGTSWSSFADLHVGPPPADAGD